ncbi:hypothetical protein GBA52_011950 [Prunus armeniaca]|nr:hypothetical protein GBA52_011950 [Prunus armeniaca]
MVFFNAPHLRLWAQLHVLNATWQGNTHFTFSQARSIESADLKIHGRPFDGPGRGRCPYICTPTDGRFHYDADETWVVGAVPGGLDLETVALHELGTFLGLAIALFRSCHASSESALDLPRACMRMIFKGIKALYNT